MTESEDAAKTPDAVTLLAAYERLKDGGYIKTIPQPAILDEAQYPMITYNCWQAAREDYKLLSDSGFFTTSIEKLNMKTKDKLVRATNPIARPTMRDLLPPAEIVEVWVGEPITLDFSGNTRERNARCLWQQLFNFYRASNCQLHKLYDLLIDLECCTEAFERARYSGSRAFMWGCDIGGYRTIFHTQDRWVDQRITPAAYARNTSFGFCVLCELTGDKAVFTTLVSDKKDK